MGTVTTIAASDFKKLHADGRAMCIDVRTPAEYASEHVDGARLFPLQKLDASEVDKHVGAAGLVYVLCKAGGRAQKAAELLAEKLDTDFCVVEGGTDACIGCGVPINKSENQSISLQRQVFITAGFFALAGAVLGYIVDPAYIGISAFVGAGLMFAGITDTCMMGMILAKMPWNKA